MSEAGYNGWGNFETWCAALWLSNDEGLCSLTQELAHDYAYVSDETEEGDAGAVEAAYQLGRALKALVEEFPPVEAVQSQASFVADLFGRAFGQVDWCEIAENLLSEIEVKS